ncbi:protein-glutamate methylesterase/protein-glutamine glutaminase [Stigmatella erecta]|uniref:Protein-glutamate methylesterase/protein-glutamine glutaminase n=1 Tax=Stigmatella erecta TaxID=83460 RepID=A0A1I0JB80_9BACT|nr:chemotaxis response regulator protein-glutamate methylesterase [Stigmatella erecta]SEU07155.1 response regulator receiver modulated CheB methylesterase [Stigmatella erecta]
MTPIRILVADDSAVARRQICQMLGTDPSLEVVAVAATGRITLEKVEEVRPDILVLDLAMPDMNGLEVLKVLRNKAPHLPVVMFSAMTERAGPFTLDALALGASDYVTKPSASAPDGAPLELVQGQLISKIKILHARNLQAHGPVKRPRPIESPVPLAKPSRVTAVVIGASTGGPNMLTEVLTSLPPSFPVPILIAQHMPPVFTRLFAERLDTLCRIRVQEARTGEVLRPGHVWIAPGDFHLGLIRDGAAVRLLTHQGPPENSCRPAADVLFRSAASILGSGVLAVVMTGMGQDGTKGSQEVHEAGGQILVQDPETCVVGGMPRAVMRSGIAHQVVPLKGLGSELLRRATRGSPLGFDVPGSTKF